MSTRKIPLAYYLFTIPGLFLYLLFYLGPALYGFSLSFSDWNGMSQSSNFVGIENYLRMFSDPHWLNSFGFTISYTVQLVFWTVGIALLLALMLNRKTSFGDWFRVLFFFPAVLSMMTVGLIWDQIYLRVLPAIGEALNLAFLAKNPLGSMASAQGAILFVDVWQGVPIPMVLLLAGLQTVPHELLESADIEGASGLRKFRSIYLPYLAPVLVVVLVLVLRRGVVVFDFIKAMTEGGPGRATESLAILVYENAFERWRFGYAMAQSIVLFVVISAMSLVFIRISRRVEVGEN